MKNPFSRTLSGNLECPHCESKDIAFVENSGPAEKRYRCRKCGGYFRYQYRNKPDENPVNVYSGHTRGLNLEKAKRFLGSYKH